jgi:hypothetical protein
MDMNQVTHHNLEVIADHIRQAPPSFLLSYAYFFVAALTCTFARSRVQLQVVTAERPSPGAMAPKFVPGTPE